MLKGVSAIQFLKINFEKQILSAEIPAMNVCESVLIMETWKCEAGTLEVNQEFQPSSFSINFEQQILFAEIPLAMNVCDGSYNGNLEVKQKPMDQVDSDEACEVKAENITFEDAAVDSQHLVGGAQLQKFGEPGKLKRW